uniref:Uncharacterized protein n=1 Tax=viral metagenome TaxID=1070528 RepID=A0A6H1ZSF4_9ZZZZ
MYSILLAVKKPEPLDHKNLEIFDRIVNTMKNLATQDKTIVLLGEGAILLPLDKGLQHVVDVVNSTRSLPYTYAIVTQDLQLIDTVSKVWT